MQMIEPRFQAGIRRLPPELVIPSSAPEKEQKMKGRTPTYNMSFQQIQDIKSQAVREATGAAWVLMLGLPVMVLGDKHGFTTEAIDAFIDGVLDLYDSYDKGYLTLSDIRQTLKDEYGLSISEERKRRRRR